MAYEIPGEKLTLVASADLSAKRYYAVALSGQKAAIAGAGVEIVGVLQQPAVAGENAEIMVTGVTKGVLGGEVADGAQVEIDASGTFITHATGVAVGFALEGGAAGNLGTILLK